MRARALAVLEKHVRTIAAQCDQTPEFVRSELNYRSLEPAIEAAMAGDAGLISCGHRRF